MNTLFARKFMPRLPRIVQDDVRFAIYRRKKRTNATRENMDRFTNDAVKHGLKCSPFIEDKYSFVDERNGATNRLRVHSGARSSVELKHSVLMSDDAIEHLALNLIEQFTRLMQQIEILEEEEGYLDALKNLSRVSASK